MNCRSYDCRSSHCRSCECDPFHLYFEEKFSFQLYFNFDNRNDFMSFHFDFNFAFEKRIFTITNRRGIAFIAGGEYMEIQNFKSIEPIIFQ